MSAAVSSTFSKAPFSIRGAPNVIIETVKRGDDDFFSDDTDETPDKPSTVVLRIYEAFGGHAQAILRVNGAFEVAKAYETNLLEDNLKELSLIRRDGVESDVEVKLNFRGFEVKTVKLVLGDIGIPDDLQDQVYVLLHFLRQQTPIFITMFQTHEAG